MNERFISIVNYILDKKIEFSQNDIAKKLGISSGYMSELMQSKKAISKQIVSKLEKVYPQFDINWLKIKEGEMLKTSVIQNNVNGDNTINITQENYMEIIREKDKQLQKSQEQIDRLISLLEKK
ncbi:MAG: helix-turn-helix transcriptional regulator [Bacteroidales bacterium]|nr:helix-turn-helix transcriptional regulator [Bacteroidales bacterium]MBR6279406.1 helix-turn-helix transcriptional regulator [Bacteroidales bacterium]